MTEIAGISDMVLQELRAELNFRLLMEQLPEIGCIKTVLWVDSVSVTNKKEREE